MKNKQVNISQRYNRIFRDPNARSIITPTIKNTVYFILLGIISGHVISALHDTHYAKYNKKPQ
jgi:hypothetical protein